MHWCAQGNTAVTPRHLAPPAGRSYDPR